MLSWAVSASGRTPYVVAAVAYARARGAHTAAVTCNHDTPLAGAADIAIVAEVGAEVISGSTRMKAGSAQKMVLNMITTGAMTRLGYVYENLMVNVHMQNSKLVERGIRILMSACKIDRPTAVETIKSAGRSVPVALVMLKAKVDKPEAVRRLAKSDGNVRLAIEDNVLELSKTFPRCGTLRRNGGCWRQWALKWNWATAGRSIAPPSVAARCLIPWPSTKS
jgi:N-acetylmuramic acid 6-phosphate etherase